MAPNGHRITPSVLVVCRGGGVIYAAILQTAQDESDEVRSACEHITARASSSSLDMAIEALKRIEVDPRSEIVQAKQRRRRERDHWKTGRKKDKKIYQP